MSIELETRQKYCKRNIYIKSHAFYIMYNTFADTFCKNVVSQVLKIVFNGFIF